MKRMSVSGLIHLMRSVHVPLPQDRPGNVTQSGVPPYAGSYEPSLYGRPARVAAYAYPYGPTIYPSPFYYPYPPVFLSPYQLYPYRYGGHRLHHHHRG